MRDAHAVPTVVVRLTTRPEASAAAMEEVPLSSCGRVLLSAAASGERASASREAGRAREGAEGWGGREDDGQDSVRNGQATRWQYEHLAERRITVRPRSVAEEEHPVPYSLHRRGALLSPPHPTINLPLLRRATHLHAPPLTQDTLTQANNTPAPASSPPPSPPRPSACWPAPRPDPARKQGRRAPYARHTRAALPRP